jgi:hypothetical protein
MHDYTRSKANTKPSLESLSHPNPAPNTQLQTPHRRPLRSKLHTHYPHRLQTPFTNFFNHPPPDFLSSLLIC